MQDNGTRPVSGGVDLEDTASSPSKSLSHAPSLEESATNLYVHEEAVVMGDHEGVRLTTEYGQSSDINMEQVSPIHESASSTVQGLDLMIGLGNEQVTVTQGSDPFNLGPIIEKTMYIASHGKKQRKNKGDYVETILNMEAATNFEITPIPNMSVSGRKKACGSLSLTLHDDMLQVVEIGHNGSPRAP
ncbi:unnamed protein product [Prunus armeniaca]|uniref:Uncharacterized protein n=1 Tax=Prunus armeniaca TaxID=36596 RepID=A0A6J5W9W1_PRUAR|nr:unnamed protein product [Prunus armeniaca]